MFGQPEDLGSHALNNKGLDLGSHALNNKGLDPPATGRAALNLARLPTPDEPIARRLKSPMSTFR
jgi:hypothetical protein